MGAGVLRVRRAFVEAAYAWLSRVLRDKSVQTTRTTTARAWGHLTGARAGLRRHALIAHMEWPTPIRSDTHASLLSPAQHEPVMIWVKPAHSGTGATGSSGPASTRTGAPHLRHAVHALGEQAQQVCAGQEGAHAAEAAVEAGGCEARGQQTLSVMHQTLSVMHQTLSVMHTAAGLHTPSLQPGVLHSCLGPSVGSCAHTCSRNGAHRARHRTATCSQSSMPGAFLARKNDSVPG